MFQKILVANRGEIACRVIKTAKRMGIKTVAVYSDADQDSLHVKMADESVHIGPSEANKSYISIDNVLRAIKETKADAVHPGYGFLSENKLFAEALEKNKVTFIGPPSAAIESMGDKITSKKLAKNAGVSTVPGYLGEIDSVEEVIKISNEIGYPVMIKASAGGGGKGMRVARNDAEAIEGFNLSKSEAVSSFGDDRIFIEKFITQPRHIEIQVLGDKHGNTIFLNERECSIQRRNQKVIEEAPSPFIDEKTRKAMGEQSCALADAVSYCSAGTVEFIVDSKKNFYFLEMNTRLQVEHPVTELITGIDLVEQMIRIAWGEKLSISQNNVTINGWAIESRIYAEDPYRNFLPSIGRLVKYRPPTELSNDKIAIRNDTGVDEGGEISIHYDPMIAKLCSWASSRNEAIKLMEKSLNEFELEGIGHNIPFLSAVMQHSRFLEGDITTAFIEEEFPDGFRGSQLKNDKLQMIAAASSAMHRLAEIRRTRISGRMDNHTRRVESDWVVGLAGLNFEINLVGDKTGSNATFSDGTTLRVESDWTPGDTIAEFKINEELLSFKVDKIQSGFRFRCFGADLNVLVRNKRQYELSRYMKEKIAPDMSKFLLCPMPGMLVSMNVTVGDDVEQGQSLCVVEAMKMENVLRAEKKGKIKKINANQGNSLSVDEVIIEFE
ncbi:MAG: acetyl/propionyl/methylcrotonyl-CoA carboxylase subunit alpha [Rhodobacteraceae bacterium]|nr:acetyl/propionyl/methylcrotonyl-CoA carboxylase subunit alpha [Paracoccaceae bacterium]